MKYCPNCQTPQQDNSQFCPRCGTPVVESQPQPQQWSPAQQPQTWTKPTEEKQRNNVLVVTIIAVAAIVICGMLIFAYITTRDKSADEAATEMVGDSAKADMSVSTANLDQNQYDWLSEREVTAADLSGKTPGDLRLMRNAIFARHGYKFKSADLQEYFKNFSWYTPQYSDVNSRLSQIEKKNIEFIKKFENGGSSSSSSSSKSTGGSRNIGYTNDYSDYVCYTWLTDSDVAGRSSSELRIMRNTIYARHGYKFKSADLREFFSRFSWYTPRYNEISLNAFSETEKHNIMLIKRYE